jgi:HD-GYP domain-containing protein (c-di-GMP phosphodiesterase class II)
MNAPAKFLTSLAQSLSTMMLYPREHPTWARAVDASYAQFLELQKENPRPHFSFLGRDVVYGNAPLHELRDWTWAHKLAEVGVQRLEFEAEVSREDYEEFIADLLSRVVQGGAGGAIVPADRSATGRQSIRFGAVTVREDEEGNADMADTHSATPTGGMEGTGLPYNLEEEAGAATWIYEQVQAKDVVPLVEADAVVRSLTVAMKGSSAMIIPLLRLKASDPYNAIHAINVAVLVMALAEQLGLGNKDVHEFGMAALLHDLGMAKVPRELVLKPIELTDEERRIVERHPVDGARIILQSDKRMELGATVAYEHHLRPDGSGYPQGLFRRPMHLASKLTRVCSVYNALRIERAHRQPYPSGQALVFIDERAGHEFDLDIARAFTTMMRKLEGNIAEVERDMRLLTPAVGLTTIPAGAGDY